MLTVCHRVVLTAEILEEWKMYRSGFSATWLVSMWARKKVCVSDPVVDPAMVDKLKRAQLSDKSEDALRKDARLVEAALATDLAVASLDEVARSLFRTVSKHWGRIKPIVWVNPAKADDQALAWLSDGAPQDKKRTLGFER
jgi:hypothetical protein